jgi:Mitochondrial K+-H+ exchange-related
MDVFVIPIASDRYELYCEATVFPEMVSEPVPQGARWHPKRLLARWRARFLNAAKAAEQRQQRPSEASGEATGWLGRAKERMMAWVAERIAEQRLLWNLRNEDAVVAVHPEDMTFEQVTTLINRKLQRDYDRHRRWMMIDSVALLASILVLGPLFLLVPGVANLPALYFGFRVVGHWFSMRGARQGLHHIAWSGRPCPTLTELREAAVLDPAARERSVRDIAARLRLPHLSRFFERVAIRHA